MELRKDYEEIRSRAIQGLCVPANQVTVGTVIDAVREAVTACQALADRPLRELSDAEIEEIYRDEFPECSLSVKDMRVARNFIAAHIAKQREPESEPLDLEKLKTGEWELLYEGFPKNTLCLQTWIARPERYTMRRKS